MLKANLKGKMRNTKKKKKDGKKKADWMKYTHICRKDSAEVVDICKELTD